MRTGGVNKIGLYMWEDLEIYGYKRFVKVIFKAYILKSYIYSLTFGFRNTF